MRIIRSKILTELATTLHIQHSQGKQTERKGRALFGAVFGGFCVQIKNFPLIAGMRDKWDIYGN